MEVEDKGFRIPIAREGFRFILPSLVLTVLFFFLHLSIIAGVFALLTLFIVYFFRDPERDIPDQSDAVLSPADGKVISIREVDDRNLLNSKGICISIFLSIFNVHINRFPCSGKIIKRAYNPGMFISAFREKASLLNEQNSILIENGGIKVIVKQIAGLIARRIVCWVKEGDSLRPGERFGLIRFGSRVDIILPLDTTICVSVGDKVKGGETIVGRTKR